MRRWQIGVIFAVGLLFGGLVVWLVTRSDNSSPSASSSSNPAGNATTSSAPGVSVNAQQLIDKLNAVSHSTYHVRYSTGSSSASHAIIEVWRTANETRRDIVAVSPTQGTAHTEEFLTKDKYIRCVSFDGKAFQCVGAPTQEGTSVSDPLQGANKAGLINKTVTVTTMKVAGVATTCYQVSADAATLAGAKFCLDNKNNVPLLIDGGDGKPVEATNFDANVPASVFTPPAKVAGS